MTTIELVFLVYSIFIVVASFINLLRIDYWWIRMWDFPHLQLAALAFAGMVGWLALVNQYGWPHWLVPTFFGASLLYQSWLIFPYTPLSKVQVLPANKLHKSASQPDPQSPKISLLVSNVLMENTKYEELLGLARKHDPDVILILEGGEVWRQQLSSLEQHYPNHILHPIDNTYGMLFYSRLPVHNAELRFLIEDHIPSIYLQLELSDGQLVHFFGVHPEPPSPTEHYRSTERDAELVLIGREARRLKGPVIVAGDLNDVAWSHTTRLFQRISGLLDPRVGRGLFNTFHAEYFFLRWPLDHIFVSEHFRLSQIERLPFCGSDHFPMHVTLTLTNLPDNRTDLPEPSQEDKAEAAEKIDEAKK